MEKSWKITVEKEWSPCCKSQSYLTKPAVYLSSQYSLTVNRVIL